MTDNAITFTSLIGSNVNAHYHENVMQVEFLDYKGRKLTPTKIIVNGIEIERNPTRTIWAMADTTEVPGSLYIDTAGHLVLISSLGTNRLITEVSTYEITKVETQVRVYERINFVKSN